MDPFLLHVSDNLTIRTLLSQDSEALFRYRSLPEVCRYQSWHPKTLAEVEAFLKSNERVALHTVGKWLQLAICLPDGTLIGDIGLHFLDADQMEIGYTLSPVVQGRGYATQAVRAIVNEAFTVWGKHRIQASVDPDNIKSVRLLERLGFRKEAHFIKSFRIDDAWYDDCVYAILREEWLAE